MAQAGTVPRREEKPKDSGNRGKPTLKKASGGSNVRNRRGERKKGCTRRWGIHKRDQLKARKSTISVHPVRQQD